MSEKIKIRATLQSTLHIFTGIYDYKNVTSHKIMDALADKMFKMKNHKLMFFVCASASVERRQWFLLDYFECEQFDGL